MEKVNYSNATHRPYNLLRLVGWANSNSVCSRYLNKNLIKIKAKSYHFYSEHGTRLQNDCNQCVCHYGELICTRYRCDNSSGTSAVIWSCPLQPNPVCTSSGKRFLNTCVAQWHGTAVEPLEHCPQEGPDGFFAPECYTVIQLVYSQKQVR
jgi:hypothetical protein